MRKKNIIVVLFALILLSVAVLSEAQVTMPMNVNIGEYKTLAIEVTTDIAESNKAVAKLEDVLFEKIREKSFFESIIKGSSGELVLKTKIVELNEVGAGGRIFFGMLAGKAKMAVDVELFDAKEKKTVGALKAKSELLGGGTYENAEEVTEKIVKFLEDSTQLPKRKQVAVQPAPPTPAPAMPVPTIQNTNEDTKTNINKLDELYKSGVLSQEEYNKAKNKLVTPQATESKSVRDKLQELEELHKKEFLSDEDYNKAKNRLKDLQKLDELYQEKVLSEEEYKKAKKRLFEK